MYLPNECKRYIQSLKTYISCLINKNLIVDKKSNYLFFTLKLNA